MALGVAVQHVGYGCYGLRAARHAYLDGVGREVVHHGLELCPHHFGADMLHGRDGGCALGGDRKDERGGITAQGRKGLQGGLNARAARTVGGGNGQCLGIKNRKSTSLNSSYANKSYAVFCFKKKQ